MKTVVGVAENANTAVLVTVAGGEVLDRREVRLTDGLLTHPHHHEGSWAIGRYAKTAGARQVSLDEAVRLVDRVRAAAERGARECLAKLAADVPSITAIAIRICPELPSTIEARIRDNRAQTYADSVMYRHALANAAQERGWSVFWYDREVLGPPSQAKHKLAAAAAIAALRA